MAPTHHLHCTKVRGEEERRGEGGAGKGEEKWGREGRGRKWWKAGIPYR